VNYVKVCKLARQNELDEVRLLECRLSDGIMEVDWNVSAVDVSVTYNETTVLQPSYVYEFSMTVSIRVSSNPGALVTSDETTVTHASYVYESPITVSIMAPSTPLASTVDCKVSFKNNE
jgi:hypothetical protein